MANPEHLEILKSGVEKWNKWIVENTASPNLLGADLRKADLRGVNLLEADLRNVDFRDSHLEGAILCEADLSGANLSGAYFCDADLSGANLGGATLVRTFMHNTILNNCNIYGISVWDMEGEIKEQKNLVITPPDQPEVTVDNIKVAQFIYLLLENKEIRDVIDTLTANAVLILGRFTDERKKVLYSLKDSLRFKGYLPILFDFARPSSKNMIQTVETLARLSKFVIADLTDSRDVRREIEAIIEIESLPIMPIVFNQRADEEITWFEDYLPKKPVIWPYRYASEKDLSDSFEDKILKPAEMKFEALRQEKLEIELRISIEKNKKGR